MKLAAAVWFSGVASKFKKLFRWAVIGCPARFLWNGGERRSFAESGSPFHSAPLRARSGFSSRVALIGLIGTLPLFGQVDSQRAVAVDLRTPQARQETVRLLTEKSSESKRQAESLARQRNWLVRGTLPSGRRVELIQAANERPQYYVTHNANAAISTGANSLRNTAPYFVNGSGFIVGVWDGGAVLSTHQEFGVRVLVKDGAGVIDHATHVAGTIGASGVVSLAQGMAPSVGIDSYDWNNDHGEMAGRAATGPNQTGNIYVSNHSYGFVRGWETGSFSGASGPHWFGVSGQREDRGFGMYDGNSASLDAVHFNAPYYLAFKSAGNDRNDVAPATGATFYYVNGGVWVAKAYNPATDPFPDGWDTGGFDTIEQEAAAKNIMTVGAVNDAVSGALRAPANGTMSAFSNWGPTDDGRIKPDIVANGVGLYSSVSTTNSSYSTYSGTSMSAPNASGTAALLIDYFGEQVPGQAMRASTLKGLLIHSADDLGTAGPDYSYGWGLIDAEAAALQIKSHALYPNSRYLYEGLLTAANPTYSFPFTWDGTSLIRATICWTDPAGLPQTGLDNRTPVLVNDLDLRITGPGGVTTHLPFVLNVNSPANAATVGDNVVDNVEQVLIAAPVAGTYTLTVSHKGALSGAQQHFSLLLNGQASESPTVVTVVASDASAGEPASGQGTGTFTFSRTGSTAAALTVNFSVSGTATSGSDFTALGSTAIFSAGSATATAVVAALDDVLVEGSETVVVTLGAGAGYAVGSPAAATVTIQDDEAGSTSFVASHVAGTLRNNFSGWVGMQVTVGASPVTVTELGRIMVSGNSGTHPVKLVKVSDGQDVPGGAVSIAMSGGTVGQFKYATLASPVVLAANTNYWLMSQETFGGDSWSDLNTTVTTTSVATVNSAAYGTGPGAWFAIAGPNQTYGPVNFKYGAGGVPATRIVGLSGNLAFGSVTVGATAQQTLTISNTGSAPLTVSGVSYPSGFSGNWAAGTIAAGASQVVTVTFAPTLASGYGGTITVSSDATGGANTIAASGTGVAAATRIIGLSGNLAFGSVTVGATAQQTLTISNTGNATLTVSGISFPSGFSGNWAAGTIAAGVSQQVTVTFAPTAATGYGGSVTVNSDATGGTNTIAASGTGVSVPPTATPFVTSFVAGTLRNNYSGWVGMQVTAGASPVTVTELGRIMVSGNSGTHTVKLVRVSDGQDVPGGSVSIAMSGGTVGQFKYATLASPVVLAANTNYWLMSEETFGGDSWSDLNTTVTTTSVATVNTAAYGTGPGAWVAIAGGNQTYGPLNFKYGTQQPDFTITASAGSGGSISPSGTITKAAGTSQTFTATPNASFSVNQWLVDGGVAQNGGTSYTLSNIQSNRTVQVTFTASNDIAITFQPQPASVVENNFIGFNVTATGTPTLTYQWQRLPVGGAWSNLSDGGGISQVATANLIIANPLLGMSGDQFRCVVSNGGGSVVSDPATLTVYRPAITNPSNQTVESGQTAIFAVTPSGLPPGALFTPRWFRRPAGGQWAPVNGGPNYSGESSFALTVSGTTLAMNGDEFQFSLSASSPSPLIFSLTSTPALLTVTPPLGATPFVTNFVAGTLRNNYSGWVGMQVTVGASPVTVTELGRIMVSGNSGTHTVKLVKVSDGQDVPGGSVSIAMSGGTVGQFKYATLASPVVLAANTNYWLLSEETFGGDSWSDLNTTVTTTSVATVNTAAYGTGPGAWFANGGGNQTYGPVNFKYGAGGGPVTRVIGLSGNLAFGSVTVGATAQQTLTISNTGNATLTVSGISFPSGFSGNWASGTIAAGASQQVTVTFAPTLATGYSGTITVDSDATSGTNTIAASGTGVSVPPTATPFVTSFVAGTLRNNYSGWVGLQVTVGANPVTVSELGRIMVAGNSGTHTVKLVRVSDGQDVPGGSVSIAMSGGTVGQFKYATLASPVVLAANTNYWLMSEETFGGDSWSDLNTTVTTTSVATVNTAAYGTGPGAWVAIAGPNQTYGPVNFKY